MGIKETAILTIHNQFCAASIANIGTLAVRKEGSQHE